MNFEACLQRTFDPVGPAPAGTSECRFGRNAMHVAVVGLSNGRLGDGHAKYLRNLVPLLRARVGKLDVYLPPGTSRLLGIPEAETDWREWPAGDHWHGFAQVRAQLAARRPDVVLLTNARSIALRDVPTVVLVGNMEPLARPFGRIRPSAVLLNLLRRRSAYSACKQATGIIALSAFTRDWLIGNWGVAPGRIDVVHHGFTPETAIVPRFVAANPGPFLFTAGCITPYRGLEDLLRAMAALIKRDPGHRLVIAGSAAPHGAGYVERLMRLARQLGVSSNLVWTGQLSPGEIAWCLAHCEGFVMTSRVEAWPNIGLEAMGYGAAIVSTRSPAMPELFGDAALYYNAGDSDALAEKLVEVLHAQPRVRGTWRMEGYRRAARFTWEQTAMLTVAALERAAGGTGGTKSPR